MGVLYIDPFRFQFNPLKIAGCKLWLDAAYPPSLTLSSGLVDQWSDRSGNGNNVTASSTARPTSGTRSQNGLNVIDFDGSTDYMTGAFAINQPCTFFAVALIDALDPTYSKALWDSNTPGTNFRYNRRSSNNRWTFRSGTTQSGAISVDTSAHLHAVGINGASSYLYIDGATASLGNPGANNLPNFSLGRDIEFVGGEWDGWMAEIIAYDTLLGSTDRQLVEAYLKSKWGTP